MAERKVLRGVLYAVLAFSFGAAVVRDARQMEGADTAFLYAMIALAGLAISARPV